MFNLFEAIGEIILYAIMIGSLALTGYLVFHLVKFTINERRARHDR